MSVSQPVIGVLVLPYALQILQSMGVASLVEVKAPQRGAVTQT
jgi:hypothetical protein